MCSYTASTPQKQPPARTAVCVSAGGAGAARSCGARTRRARVCMSGSSRDEAERDRVHAVAQASRPRAVAEDMAEVRGAACAADFLTAHAGRLALALEIGRASCRERV